MSDLHLDGSDRAGGRAERVRAYLAGLPGRLDAVLVSGDIADHGLPEEYAPARAVLDLPHPVLVLPGNHDVRGPFRTGLLDEPASDEPINRVAEVGGAVFALCGHAHTAAASTFAGRPLLVAPGVVSTIRLPWEGSDVVDLDQPAAVAFHVLDDGGRLTTHYRFVA
ncbi:metallophosphoesterase [Actinosynnema sp. NPDC059797]